MIRMLHVVGARPNFMKVMPVISEMARHSDCIGQVLVHTGQHYDYNMSRVFFEELEIPEPDEFLGVGAGTHTEQTARVMLGFETVLKKHLPDWVIVYGDVNSTVACAMVAAKLGIPVAHVEAGLRSGDRTMPEEINRVLTDHIADLHLTPSADADENLIREGVPQERIHLVGNVMIDTLRRMLPRTDGRSLKTELALEDVNFAMVTLHRPSNVDDSATLEEVLAAIKEIASRLPVVFPVHPRTRQRMASMGMNCDGLPVHLLDPLGYLDFLSLLRSARFVLTDSGGVQEETAYLGVPCLTVRSNTERPITITSGTNRLVGSSRAGILKAVNAVLDETPGGHRLPSLWDGHAAARIVSVFLSR